ncbi:MULTISPECIES: hypothetical protein [unclassified Paracoccus (in: a-proteobacteria)]|uniref:hypothetical protein n=1 Tax=unclassified Paracoccus (in: a-proteobacteria) TaxID=2688777 RepID=UPI0012B31534|nr:MULTISPECIES: hypothetical protein [unclassified Paracoccus (in: a-proteobacteria)]UXU75398.1 hypothetical protein GB879_002545 [Paracoccus sp. SMMA_5]UXU81303.1 hypothetical protein GB880_002540 [Paracoccus sp. SMMA_5_TC]
MSHTLGDFPPIGEQTGTNPGFRFNCNRAAGLLRSEGYDMKAASLVINLGFGLGLALGAVALLLL